MLLWFIDLMKRAKLVALQLLIAIRLATHDGIFVSVSSPKPRLQPPEVKAAVRRTRGKGSRVKYCIQPQKT